MRLALTALALGLIANPVLAASPVGVWNTPEQNGKVQIYSCGEGICGKVIDSARFATDPNITDLKNKDASLRSRPLKGLVILTGFTGGPTEWKGGSVYNPEDGGTYHGTIKLENDDTLKLTGCIMVPFCKAQTWHRAK